MKKFLLMLLGALLALPSLARDFTYTYEGQTLTYTVLDEEAKTCETKAVSDFDGQPGNEVSATLVIPAMAKDGENSYTVTQIGSFFFSTNGNLTSVEIPNSVITIGDDAFSECYELMTLSLGNSISKIGEDAFSGCQAITDVYYKITAPIAVSEENFSYSKNN